MVTKVQCVVVGCWVLLSSICLSRKKKTHQATDFSLRSCGTRLYRRKSKCKDLAGTEMLTSFLSASIWTRKIYRILTWFTANSNNITSPKFSMNNSKVLIWRPNEKKYIYSFYRHLFQQIFQWSGLIFFTPHPYFHCPINTVIQILSLIYLWSAIIWILTPSPRRS